MTSQAYLWIGFGVLVVGALTIDLGFFQRKAHVIGARESLTWTLVWIALAMVFGAGIFHYKGAQAFTEFLTGYLLEKALSVDNLFVFIVIFSYFGVPKEYESRILMWGVLGAVVMRALFIVVGIALINMFAWMMYVFGALLLVTGFKILVSKEGSVQPDKNPVVRLFKKFFAVTDRMDGQKFFTRIDGKLFATPLFLVILVVESTDVIFAVDSIPAIFAVTKDPFIVFTSNIFAILGLRALYFLLARMMSLFRFLKYGLVLILWFIGVKMMLHHYKISVLVSLGIIVGVLAVSIFLSLMFRDPHRHDPPKQDPPKKDPPKQDPPP